MAIQKKEPKITASIPMMVDDPKYSGLDQIEKRIEFHNFHEDYFLDGPVTRRVAVLDFDEKTGALLPGVPYERPKPGNKLGSYKLAPDSKNPDTSTRAFNQVSAFATVLKTIQMFEKADVLGREVCWAFSAPQLLVLPRAGQLENAYYERDSHSLQFFYFPSHENDKEMIYTSLARDIVAHETGHAILDGIAPHLWNAITPQSRALHEAIGDLTALLLSIDSPYLRQVVLKQTHGSIRQSTHFSALAEQFGLEQGRKALRNLYDEELEMGPGIRSEEHDLCRVLTAALYSVLVNMHDERKKQEMIERGGEEYEVSGRALAIVAAQFCRMIMRALDSLPPGENSFADYGRAIIAADQAAHPDDIDKKGRDWLCQEFVRRHIVSGPQALVVEPPPEDGLKGIDLPDLINSDWAAYDFANSDRGRELLSIPKGVQFQIEPRLEVERKYYHRDVNNQKIDELVNECLFKVWWYQEEPNNLGPAYRSQRKMVFGTTLAWERDTGKPRILLTSNPGQRPDEQAEQQANRDAMLRKLIDLGSLRPGPQYPGPDGRPSRFATGFDATSKAMRVNNIAHTLQ
jgi:hypothetical protein